MYPSGTVIDNQSQIIMFFIVPLQEIFMSSNNCFKLNGMLSISTLLDSIRLISNISLKKVV
jgi:hypothetical protein